jgi:spermidine synthase
MARRDAATSADSYTRSAPEVPFWLLPTLAGLLLFSGVCALVYQVLWLRLLSLTFGVTTYAASTVLASFMGGLALGSFVAGRVADRVRRPLFLFGIVELLIGACALATPAALAGVHRLFVEVAGRLPDSLAVSTAVRLVLSFAVLLVPTALMGATLPIVVKSSLTRLDRIGTRVGLLYASNTTGAILGAMLAGFYLIPQIGLRRSFLLAASINGTVGLIAILIAWGRGRVSIVTRVGSDPEPQGSDPTRALIETRPLLVVLIVFAVSGFASLALEVIWFRVLGIMLGPTSYVFTLMLAFVLAGIALGSAIITPVMRWRLDWLQVLAILQLAAGIVAVRSFGPLRRTPQPPDWLPPLLAGLGLDFLATAATVSIGAILPTAIFFGLAFPVGLRLWAGAAGTERHTAERVGVFYSVNVGAAIVGSIAAGFVLLPRLGSQISLITVAALFVASGLLIQAVIARRQPVVALVVAATAVIVFLTQAKAVPDPKELARRWVRISGPILWQEEGMQTTVAVSGSQAVGSRVMYLDGRHQANDTDSMVFIHRRIGLLPAVLHEHPTRALVVGLGGGVTPGGLSQFPGLAVDVVELSDSVIRSAAFFSHVNFDVLHRPNVRIMHDDGRNYLLRARTLYDVITADAILPHHAGANNLNSVEYFRLVRDRLAPDGIALHWNGGVTDAEHKMILRAFVDAFPEATLWGDGTLMIGSKRPLSVSQARIESLLADPAGRQALALMHVGTLDHLLRMFRASPRDIRAYLGPGPALSDDKPALEYFASLPQTERDLSRIGRDSSALIRP